MLLYVKSSLSFVKIVIEPTHAMEKSRNNRIGKDLGDLLVQLGFLIYLLINV